MIEMPNNWDDIPETHPGERRQQPPPGAYICKIIDAYTAIAKSGSPMIVLVLDIAQGEFTGYYSDDNDWRARRNYDPKWPLLYQVTNGNSVSHFKGLIRDIEKSNPDYIFKGDEKTLKDKLVGILFDAEEYEVKDEIRYSLKPARSYSCQSVWTNNTNKPRIRGINGQYRNIDDPPPPPPTSSTANNDVNNDDLLPQDEVDIPF